MGNEAGSRLPDPATVRCPQGQVSLKLPRSRSLLAGRVSTRRLRRRDPEAAVQAAKQPLSTGPSRSRAPTNPGLPTTRRASVPRLDPSSDVDPSATHEGTDVTVCGKGADEIDPPF